MIFIMWYPLRVIINLLPLKVIYYMGVLGGTQLYFISRYKHEIMAKELSIIMPDKSVRNKKR